MNNLASQFNQIPTDYLIGGGNKAQVIVEALCFALQIYDTTAKVLTDAKPTFLDSTTKYAKFGQALSDNLFNLTYPDPLGKMIFYRDDFQVYPQS